MLHAEGKYMTVPGPSKALKTGVLQESSMSPQITQVENALEHANKLRGCRYAAASGCRSLWLV